MKKTKLFLLLAIMFCLGCNSDDQDESFKTSQERIDLFFEYSGKNSLTKQMIVDFKKEPRLSELVDKLSLKFGYPNWDVARRNLFPKTDDPRSQASGGSESEAEVESPDPEVLVPLVLEGSERASAIIAWRKLKNGKHAIRIFDRQVYENLTPEQQGDSQARVIAGHFFVFEYSLFGSESLEFGDLIYKFDNNVFSSETCEYGEPDCNCTKVLYVSKNTGETIGHGWINCERSVVVVLPDQMDNVDDTDLDGPTGDNSSGGDADTGIVADIYDAPVYYDILWAENDRYKPNGGGNRTDYSQTTFWFLDFGFDTFVFPELPTVETLLDQGPVNTSRTELINYLTLVSSEMASHTDTQEAGISINEASQYDLLTNDDLILISSKAREMHLALKYADYDFDLLSDVEKNFVTKHAAFIDLYPQVKQEINDGIWPLSSDDWEAVWQIMKPLIGDLLIESLPGGGITLAFRDIIEGANNGDVVVITAAVVALIVEFVPVGKLFKSIWRTGKLVKRSFKYVRIARHRLKTIGTALKSGIKADIDGAIVRLSRNGEDIGIIKNGDIVPSKYSSHGTPVGDSEGGYQLVKNGDDFGYKRTPDVSNYSSIDLNKLTDHPSAHTLERHGHDVSDEALKKRAQTGVAPDGTSTVSGNPPSYSSKFASQDKIKEVLNNIGPGSPSFSPPAGRNTYVFTYPVSGQAASPFGYGFPAGGSNPVQMSRVEVIYRKVGGEWKLFTMFPKP